MTEKNNPAEKRDVRGNLIRPAVVEPLRPIDPQFLDLDSVNVQKTDSVRVIDENFSSSTVSPFTSGNIYAPADQLVATIENFSTTITEQVFADITAKMSGEDQEITLDVTSGQTDSEQIDLPKDQILTEVTADVDNDDDVELQLDVDVDFIAVEPN